ncbi:MAG: hypothetical protein ACTSQE_16310 [Candidatus Heimdallarchaeaceae archaeon]
MIKEKNNYVSDFIVADASSSGLVQLLEVKGFNTFNNAILLGNSIANMGSYNKAKQALKNIYDLLKQGGRFITQTINKPSKPHFIGLRTLKNSVLQRIMIPVCLEDEDDLNSHNIELYFNSIDLKKKIYVDRRISKLYMFEAKNYEFLVKKIGFEIVEKFGGFNKEDFTGDGAKTALWVLEK